MRVLICGDRDWDDKELMKEKIQQLMPSITIIINGKCSGADQLSSDIADELGIPKKEYPADWDLYELKAGPIRNTKMLVEGKPDLVLAFHDYLETSKGTKDMVKKAATAGVSVIFIKHNEAPHVKLVTEMMKALYKE